MSQVQCIREKDIVIISIERAEVLNALSRTIVDDIDRIIEDIKTDDSVRCVIFHSKKNFAAGADIKDMAKCNEEKAKKFSFTPTFNKIESIGVPVIAAIEGYALGGGMELAMAADIRIAETTAKIGFPEVSLGIFPGAGGTVRVPRVCGEAFAKELIFTGVAVSAERAVRMGIVNQVVGEGEALEAALKMARRISECAPIAVRMAKEVIKRGLEEHDILKATEIERLAWSKLFNTEDQKEGMKAFIEKRRPNYRNK